MKPKQFFYLLGVLTFILLMGGGFGYYRAATGIAKSTTKLSKELAEVQVASEKGVKLAKLSKEYQDDIRQLLPQLDKALPNSKRQSELTKDLQTAAQRSGVRLASLSFSSSDEPSGTSQTEATAGLLAMPLSFTAQGNYPSLQSFLQRLESFPRQADVVSLAITKSEGSLVSAQLKVNFYLKP